MTNTVLITGANAGLGFESARQIASSSRWDHIVLTARSTEKGNGARDRLVSLTGRAPSDFSVAIFDNNIPDTILDAVAALARQGRSLDAIILNAGGMGRSDDSGLPLRLPTGLSEMFAMNVGGHAVLVHGLIDAGLLSPGATVMLAGSEASRGIAMMNLPAPTMPTGIGDLDATLTSVAQGTHADDSYNNMVDYGLIKLIGTLWMRRLHKDHGLRALTVSPGFTAGTEAMKKLPALQQLMFRYIALPLFRLTGNAHGLEFGARRYVQALEDLALEAGGFYASPGKGISGTLTPQSPKLQPLLADAALEEAVGRLIDREVGARQRVA